MKANGYSKSFDKRGSGHTVVPELPCERIAMRAIERIKVYNRCCIRLHNYFAYAFLVLRSRRAMSTRL